MLLHHFGTLVPVALNIKDPEAERLAAEVAALAGESKTRAVRVALAERRDRLSLRGSRPDRARSLRRVLEHEVWPALRVEGEERPLTRAEREEILGYGPDGV